MSVFVPQFSERRLQKPFPDFFRVLLPRVMSYASPEPITEDHPYTNCVPESGVVLVTLRHTVVTWSDSVRNRRRKCVLAELSTVAMFWKIVAFFKIIFVFVHKKY